MNLFLQPFHTQQRRVPRAAEPAAGQGRTVGTSSDSDSPDPLLGSGRGSWLRPPRAKLKGKIKATEICTRVRPGPGSASARGEEKPSKASWDTENRCSADSELEAAHALGSVWGLKSFQSHIFPFFLLSPGAEPAAEHSAMPRQALAGPVLPGAERPPSSSWLSALPLAPPHLPARYRPRGHRLTAGDG